MIEVTAGVGTSVAFLLIAHWRRRDSDEEAEALSEMGASPRQADWVGKLHRFEITFYYFASGSAAAIALIRALI